MKIYRTKVRHWILDEDVWRYGPTLSFDALFQAEDPRQWLEGQLEQFSDVGAGPEEGASLRPPLESQEIWAAGVTYIRSREARMEESEREADIYDRVYDAERPELFFKATPHRVVGDGEEVQIRSDSDWNVPEAELVLAINRQGTIFGYSIGNDMSSRSIEGANPLYLPQAKIYDGSCALGPCLYVSETPLASSTEIAIRVIRDDEEVFEGRTSLSEMKRQPEELVRYLFRDNSFPDGCYLLTGTGIVPSADFTLEHGDRIAITIDPIGTLTNTVR